MRRLSTLGIAALALVGSVALPAWGSAGRLDPSFGGGDGKVTTRFGDRRAAVVAGLVDRGGRITVVGMADRQLAMARYLPDGRLDRSLGGDGKVRAGVDGLTVSGFAVTPSHRIVVTAFNYGPPGAGDDDFAVYRYRAGGSLDTGFGRAGRSDIDLGTNFDEAYDTAVQPDGGIVVVGQSGADGGVVRLRPPGGLDRSFHMLRNRFGLDAVRLKAARVLRDGRILVAGEGVVGGCSGGGCTIYQVLARLKPNGTLDPSFGGGDGSVTRSFDAGCYGCSVDLAVGPSGRIFVLQSNAVGAYTAAGKIDWAFGDKGAVFLYPKMDGTGGGGVTVQGNGRIVVAAERIAPIKNCVNCPGGFGLARYLPDGRADRSFGGDGMVVSKFMGTPCDVAFRGGRITAMGSIRHGFVVARYVA